VADVHTPKQRSYNMSCIKGKNTKPELVIRSELHKRGFRFRLHSKRLPGKPDIVLPKYKAVIFVNGCFWHYHNCKLFKMPQTRTEWWRKKLEKTRSTDRVNIKRLLKTGWKVLVIWECSFASKKNYDKDNTKVVVDSLTGWLRGDINYHEIDYNSQGENSGSEQTKKDIS
jgi:DNA mismatch endonuclease, patch repair protein